MDSSFTNSPFRSIKLRSLKFVPSDILTAVFNNVTASTISLADAIIPDAAFNTSINVPPTGEILISGGERTNAFDNNFITFDSSTETFDETTITTLFSDTALKFDSSTIKFDGSGGDTVPRDVVGLYKNDFSDTTVSFDSSINKFDEQNTVASGSSIPRFDDGYTRFDRSNLKFDNTSIPERFSSNQFKFDLTSKTFDIGDLPT